MELIQDFKRIMDETYKIALATSVDNIPNVRVVNFCDIPENKGVIYFASFRGLPKTLEVSQNNIVYPLQSILVWYSFFTINEA